MPTTINTQLVAIVDGHTISVKIPNQKGEKLIRACCLHTENAVDGISGPASQVGKMAAAAAARALAIGDYLDLEFPGDEPVDVCMTRYRSNTGEVLAFVSKGKVDLQRLLIEQGYAAYLTKYGYAPAARHAVYESAEREAQSGAAGIWDERNLHPSNKRDYRALSTWWHLRAEIVENFRDYLRNTRRTGRKPDWFCTRVDNDALREKASKQESANVFTEFANIQFDGRTRAIVSNGSDSQPFDLAIPDLERSSRQSLVRLLRQRYLPNEKGSSRSYGYVTGDLELENGRLQMTLRHIRQISDIV